MNTTCLEPPVALSEMTRSANRLRMPAVRGLIHQRLLLNFRVNVDAAATLLPPGFRPKLLKGFALVGVCLVRFHQLRPTFLPAWCGLDSENAAHRIAVEWNENGRTESGVFIARRDTGSTWNHLVGGRLFPGEHHFARFQFHETPERLKLDMRATSDDTRVRVHVRKADDLPAGSVFRSVSEASEFFRLGAVGWSECRDSEHLEGMELVCPPWTFEPLIVEWAESTWFNRHLPPGAMAVDSAFMIRNVPCEWRAHGRVTGRRTP